MIIDAHTHVIPLPYLRELDARPNVKSLRVRDVNSERPIIETVGVQFSLSPIWFDAGRIVEHMDRNAIAAHVVSPPTFLFHYSDEPARAAELARVINDSYAQFITEYPGRFYAMGTVPLHDVDLACRELNRLVSELSIKAVEIGSFVNGLSLDSEKLRPFFQEAERLGVFVFVHPLTQQQVGEQALEFAYLRNLVGLPTSTAFSIESLIFSDFLGSLPDLKIGFAHGGGVSAGLLSRWEGVWQSNVDIQQRCSLSPFDAFKALYFDTVMHSVGSLDLLLNYCDPQKVLLGSDFPADMGITSLPGKVAETTVYGSGHADAITWKTTHKLFSGALSLKTIR